MLPSVPQLVPSSLLLFEQSPVVGLQVSVVHSLVSEHSLSELHPLLVEQKIVPSSVVDKELPFGGMWDGTVQPAAHCLMVSAYCP